MAHTGASKTCQWQVVFAQSGENLSFLLGHLHFVIIALLLMMDHHHAMGTAIPNSPTTDAGSQRRRLGCWLAQRGTVGKKEHYHS